MKIDLPWHADAGRYQNPSLVRTVIDGEELLVLNVTLSLQNFNDQVLLFFDGRGSDLQLRATYHRDGRVNRGRSPISPGLRARAAETGW
jgi:hypothetical protein